MTSTSAKVGRSWWILDRHLVNGWGPEDGGPPTETTWRLFTHYRDVGTCLGLAGGRPPRLWELDVAE
jgi:hypothetical protein